MRKTRTPEQLKQYNENRKKKYHENAELRAEISRKSKLYRENNKEALKVKNKEQHKNYCEANPEKIKAKGKKWRDNNKDYIKKYRKANKDRRKITHDTRIKNDPIYALTVKMRSKISKTFSKNGFTKASKTFEIVGCSYEELKQHLETKFLPWMTWENRGLYNGSFNYGWDIDHRVPLSSAKTEEELLTLCHYSNLQPLCSKVNRDIKKAN